jgi:hypothetical protein
MPGEIRPFLILDSLIRGYAQEIGHHGMGAYSIRVIVLSPYDMEPQTPQCRYDTKVVQWSQVPQFDSLSSVVYSESFSDRYYQVLDYEGSYASLMK